MAGGPRPLKRHPRSRQRRGRHHRQPLRRAVWTSRSNGLSQTNIRGQYRKAAKKVARRSRKQDPQGRAASPLDTAQHNGPWRPPAGTARDARSSTTTCAKNNGRGRNQADAPLLPRDAKRLADRYTVMATYHCSFMAEPERLLDLNQVQIRCLRDDSGADRSHDDPGLVRVHQDVAVFAHFHRIACPSSIRGHRGVLQTPSASPAS